MSRSGGREFRLWNEPQFGAATGGAPSLFFSVPSYQSGLGLATRTVPDIAYNAAINGGALALDMRSAASLSSVGPAQALPNGAPLSRSPIS